MSNNPYIIIGSGLSGLACAITLKKSNHKILVLEAQSQVGGRLQSQRNRDGFIIDEGFQVILASYPELKKFVAVDELKLQSFNSGALIYNGQGFDLLANPIKHPSAIKEILINKNLNFKDRLLVLKLLLRSQKYSSDSPVGSVSTESFLQSFGLSSTFIEYFWRPFLSGVYLDRHLESGSHFFQFLIRCFGFGTIALPEEGMNALPQKMSEKLGLENLRLNCKVKSWTHNTVTLESGETLQAEKVICAFDANPPLDQLNYREVTTHYFTSDEFLNLKWDKWLILVPAKFNLSINHMAMLTNVNSNYSTSGKPLLSVSVLSGQSNAIKVAAELKQLLQINNDPIEVSTTVVKRALPEIKSSQTLGFGIIDGIYYCGDRWTSPSINGALRSGRLVAEEILKRI